MLLDRVRQLHRDKPLAGRRIAVLATDGFEMVELAVPAAAMRLAGATVDVISIHPGRIRGMNLHEPASTVGVDLTLDQADPAEYDGLLIPGGFVNPDLMRQSAAARAFVRAFGESGKPIASLCHGPWVLASAGLLEGRRLTSWPGLRDDLVNAGATWLNEPLVHDGNLVTSRGPQDLKPFVAAITRLFAGADRELEQEFPSSRATQSAPPAGRAAAPGRRRDALDAQALGAHDPRPGRRRRRRLPLPPSTNNRASGPWRPPPPSTRGRRRRGDSR